MAAFKAIASTEYLTKFLARESFHHYCSIFLGLIIGIPQTPNVYGGVIRPY